MEAYFGRHTINHTDLIDMPSATNIDHDGRYLQLAGGTIIGTLTVEGGLTMSSHISMGANYAIYWDTGDYIIYDQGNNDLLFYFGGAAKALIDADKIETAGYFQSDIATGTIPVQVTSTTKCTNLNVDRLDDYHAGNSSGQVPVSNGTKCTNLNADKVDGYDAGNSSGQVALSNGTKCTNLNADKVDGYDAGNSSGQVALSNGTKCTNLNADMLDNRHITPHYGTGASVNDGSYLIVTFFSSEAGSSANLGILNHMITGQSVAAKGLTYHWNQVDTTSDWKYYVFNDTGSTYTIGYMGVTVYD